jgi:hypothetical protein
MLLNKIEEYLNGWLKGYSKALKLESLPVKLNDVTKKISLKKLKIRMDVFVSPIIETTEAMDVNLYEWTEIDLQENSIFKKYHGDIDLGNSTKMSALIYRCSEQVGPSPLVGYLAKSVIESIKKEKVKLLFLFSGTGLNEYYLKRHITKQLSFVSIDINPTPYKNKKNVAYNSTYHEDMHIVPADIFSLTSHYKNKLYNEPNDIYYCNYDLIIADPPHYLSMDFLSLDVGNKTDRNPLYNHLKDSNAMFLLYYGHKEKEWMRLYISSLFSRTNWKEVFTIIIADESFILALPKNINDDQLDIFQKNWIKRMQEIRGHLNCNINIFNKYFNKLQLIK